RKAQRAGDIHGLVPADVVDQDDIRDYIFGNVRIGFLQRFRRIICGQDDNNPRTWLHDVIIQLRSEFTCAPETISISRASRLARASIMGRLSVSPGGTRELLSSISAAASAPT